MIVFKDTENKLFTTTKNISEYIAVCTKIGVNRDRMNGFYNEMKNNPRGNWVFDLGIASVLITNKVGKLATVNTNDFKNITEIGLIDLDTYEMTKE